MTLETPQEMPQTDAPEQLSVSAGLKARTEGHHQKIEHVSRFRRMFAEDYTVAEYQDLLAHFYGFFTPLEQLFQANAPWFEGLDLPRRLRSDLLRRDLLALGMSQDEVDALPLCQDLPNCATRARAMGCFYVLEGSTLGGMGISRRMGQAFGLTPETGVGFYSGHGPETMPMWQGFKAYLDAVFTVEDALDEMASTAEETFDGLARWMSR